MSDIYSILQSSYLSAANTTYSNTPYTPVDAKQYTGTWSGAYSDNTKFTLQISNVQGFRATVRYQSGSTLQYQQVLIKDNSFKFGDSKFTLTQTGTAQLKTVNTDPATGTEYLDSAYATLDQ